MFWRKKKGTRDPQFDALRKAFSTFGIADLFWLVVIALVIFVILRAIGVV